MIQFLCSSQGAFAVKTGQKRGLRDEIARQPIAVLKTALQKELALLERLLERVDEA